MRRLTTAAYSETHAITSSCDNHSYNSSYLFDREGTMEFRNETSTQLEASSDGSKLTRQEAAARLRIHTDTLDRWAGISVIPCAPGGLP